ncbi:MAG: AAA family ATPase [Prevotellaceae bacterium]|jgi:predicted ATPase|nr:AAA family ATPase [Prevotellaceae bacterium]
MQESIIIRNFGPIKDIEIRNINPFTIFIGESGSGKSTVMKVIVLFRWIYKMLNIRSYLKYAKITESPFKFDFKEYMKNGGFEEDAYLLSDTEIIYRRNNNEISYKGSLNAAITIPESELSLEKMSFIADKRNVVPDILANNVKADSFFINETYSDFKIAYPLIKELSMNYLGVKYTRKKTGAVTKHFIENIDTNKKYPPIKLENASSGMQTVTPLSVIVEYFAKHYNFSKFGDKIIFKYLYESDALKKFNPGLNIGEIKNKNIHIHIEEPELSLYPESQRSLLNFIVNRCFVEKHNDYNMTIMMATHSPYIINHLNLLIKAYDKDTLIEGAKLNYDDISVYQVEDGEINDLKIQNDRLIYTNPLSDTINNIYDEYGAL